jgi:hypothetical protein
MSLCNLVKVSSGASCHADAQVRTLAETLRRLGADKEADELKAQHKQQFVANAKKTRKPAMNRTVSVKGF